MRLPAEFRFEGTEVEVHRDPQSCAVVLTPVRPSARTWLQQRDALLQEAGMREHVTAFWDVLRDDGTAQERGWP